MASLYKTTPSTHRPKFLVSGSHVRAVHDMGTEDTLDLIVTSSNDVTGADIYYTLHLGPADIKKLKKELAYFSDL